MATPSYYRQQAQAYAQATQGVDMAALYARFTPHLPTGGRVLDAGCGAGRDARAFAAMGYQVAAFDASPQASNENGGLMSSASVAQRPRRVDCRS